MKNMRFFVGALSCILLTTSCKTVVKQSEKTALARIAKEVVETGSSKTLKEIASSNKTFRLLFSGLEKSVSKEFSEDIVVTKVGKDLYELASRQFPNSRILLNLKKRTVECAGGSLKNSGPVNEFLNVLLPNMTYKVDGCFTYITDRYGRAIRASANRSEAFGKIYRNTQRNSNVQKMIVDQLDGIQGVHDGGHLFSNTSGGLNELINQVPMVKELNRNGKWRALERIEEDALRAGKHVISKRKLLYKGKSKCPYAIEFTYIIDGKKTSVLVKNS